MSNRGLSVNTTAPKSWTYYRVRSGVVLPDDSRSYEYDAKVNIVAIGGAMMEAKRVASKVAKADKGNRSLRVFVEMEELHSN